IFLTQRNTVLQGLDLLLQQRRGLVAGATGTGLLAVGIFFNCQYPQLTLGIVAATRSGICCWLTWNCRTGGKLAILAADFGNGLGSRNTAYITELRNLQHFTTTYAVDVAGNKGLRIHTL